jgi:hypothetical protein
MVSSGLVDYRRVARISVFFAQYKVLCGTHYMATGFYFGCEVHVYRWYICILFNLIITFISNEVCPRYLQLLIYHVWQYTQNGK